MKSQWTLFAALAAAAAIAAALTVQSAAADTGGVNHAYVCYSATAQPIVAAANDSSVFPTWDTFATGYFTPYAETSVPTASQAGDYYLTCALGTGWTEIGTYVLGDGSLTPINGPNPYVPNGLPEPGVYPVIQSAAPPAA